MMKTWPAWFVVAAWLLSPVFVLAQQAQSPGSDAADQSPAISDEEISLLRKDIRSKRKQIVAQNLNLSDREAQQFWPVYDRYIADLIKINDTKYKLVQDYFQNRNQLTDAQANTWIEQWLKVDQDTVSLRTKYLPDFRKVLPARKVALYEQLDRRTQLMIDLQLSSQVPLVEAGH